MMKLKQLGISYDQKDVLHHISMDWDGKGMCIIGGINGSGKSTLLKSMMHLVDYMGSMMWDDKEIAKMNESTIANHFAYVPQQKALPMHESVEEFLLLGSAFRLSLFEQPTKMQIDNIDEVLTMFHLMHLKGCFMDELSGGEVQMLYVARCFMEKHDVLILDEPCTYLDYHRQYLFMNQLKTLLKQNHMGAVISIHDPNLALLFADRILLLHEHTLYYDHSIHTNEDKKIAAKTWNTLYENAFTINDDEDSVIMRWK